MEVFVTAPCIPDEGITARIPDSPFSVLTLIETRNRLRMASEKLSVTPEILSQSMHLSLAQVYAALAYYHANQAAFDNELTHRWEAGQQALTALLAERKGRNGWAEILGKWPGDETDEEIAAALERLG